MKHAPATSSLVDAQLDYILAESLLKRPGSDGLSPTRVRAYIERSMALADYLSGKAREKQLLRSLKNLINGATDPLHSLLFRQYCLDNLNRPLLSLSRIYRQNPDGQRYLNALKYELHLMQRFCYTPNQEENYE